jgi:predicted transcriptional regulator
MIDMGWITQSQIEARLGYGRTVANDFMKKLYKLGFIVRRNRDGTESYARRAGYEWKWVYYGDLTAGILNG